MANRTATTPELRSWIFKALPTFRLKEAVRKLPQIQWRVHFTKAIRKNHTAYLWLAGPTGGIVARGRITTDPELTTDKGWDKEFGSGPHDPDTPANYVIIDIDETYDTPLTREECLAHVVLKEMHVIKGKQGTNFTVTPEQAVALEEILASRSNEELLLAALEGATYRAERQFRERNRNLIAQKKELSNGHCTVCEFSFRAQYKGLLREYLVAHHAQPIGDRSEPSITTLDNIDLLCPNCHAAVHSVNPPLAAAQLKAMCRGGWRCL